jgi:hypothetical protein
MLRDMTELDPTSAMSLAARAWQAWTLGETTQATILASAAAAAAHRRPRRERQQVQIVQLAISGDHERASGLAAEHLAEFAGDDLIHRIRAWITGRPGNG